MQLIIQPYNKFIYSYILLKKKFIYSHNAVNFYVICN